MNHGAFISLLLCLALVSGCGDEEEEREERNREAAVAFFRGVPRCGTEGSISNLGCGGDSWNREGRRLATLDTRREFPSTFGVRR